MLLNFVRIWHIISTLDFLSLVSAAHATGTESEDAVIIDVTDFGADKTGLRDSSPAMIKAVAEAKRLSDAGREVVISFPKGRYDFYPEYAFEKKLYISNTTCNEAFLNKKIAILIEDMKNVTVDGGGSLFMLHGRMGGFFAIHSENVTFQDFTIDMQVPTVIDVTVEGEAGTHSVIARIPACYPYEVRKKDIVFYGDSSPYTGDPYWELMHSTFAPRTQKRDLRTGATRRIMEKMLLTNAVSVEALEDNRVRITYAAATDVPMPGTVIQMRRNDRDVTGAYFWDCRNVIARNIDVGFMHGFGICAQTTENITLDGVRFQTLPGKGTFSTCTADQVHLVSCYGDMIIKGCYFENPHDDPINVHGHHMSVTKISDDRTQVRIKAMHGSPYGVANFCIGDEIEFIRKSSLTVSQSSKRRIVAIDGPDGKGGMLGAGTGSISETVLTLSEPISDDIGVDAFLVENVTATPNVLIRDCQFVAVPTRGILCTTKGRVVIENNVFDRIACQAIYISDDGNGWYESGRCEDVTIRNNVFKNNRSYEIHFDPICEALPPKENAIHKNVLIEGNTFLKAHGNSGVLAANSVDGIVIRRNRVYRENPDVEIRATVLRNAMGVGDTQQIGVTADGTALGSSPWKFVNSGNIVLENNLYDGGIDASIRLIGADGTDVKITDDVAEIGAPNPIPVAGEKYHYESSNEAVATVSSDGMIFAIGAGTAEITVYSVIGERRYEAAPVVITVSDDEGLFLAQ